MIRLKQLLFVISKQNKGFIQNKLGEDTEAYHAKKKHEIFEFRNLCSRSIS